MHDTLNPAQLRAVHHLSGPCLVVAGAGSGKTRVITHKIARLMQSGIEPHRIAAYAAADAHTAAYVCVSAQALCYSDLRLGLDVHKAVVVPNGIEPRRPSPAMPLGGAHPLRAELGLERQALHHHRLVFKSPARSAPIEVVSPLAGDLAEWFAALPE